MQPVSPALEQSLKLGTPEPESDELDSSLLSETDDSEEGEDIELTELALSPLPPPSPPPLLLPPLPPLESLARATLRVVKAGAA